MDQVKVIIDLNEPETGISIHPDPSGYYSIPQDYLNIKSKYLKLVNGVIREKNNEEKRIIDLPLKYRTYSGSQWAEKTSGQKESADHQELEQWQTNKPQLLKIIENIYVDFLINMWTNLLRSKGIINSGFTITVSNTNEIQNIQYLIILRQIDFNSYNLMASEFQRLKQLIEGNGGIMSKVIHHDDIIIPDDPQPSSSSSV